MNSKQKYVCDMCNFSCYRLSHYETHLKTQYDYVATGMLRPSIHRSRCVNKFGLLQLWYTEPPVSITNMKSTEK